MALIERFEERPLTPSRVHAGVTCGYRSVLIDGRQILQLETYGSERRKHQGQVSQVIQLDERAARRLMEIIEQTFPDLS